MISSLDWSIQTAVPPPSACSVEPVMKLERGEARKSTAWAISSGVRGAAQRQRTTELVVGVTPFRLHAFGFGRSGRDAVDPHPAGAELGGPGAGEGFHGGLGRAVGGRAGHPLGRDHAGDVDDRCRARAPASPAPAPPPGSRCHGRWCRRSSRTRDLLIDGQRRGKAGGVVHQDVDLAGLLRQAISPTRGRPCRPGRTARSPSMLGGGGLAALRVPAGDDHRAPSRPAAGHTPGRCPRCHR